MPILKVLSLAKLSFLLQCWYTVLSASRDISAQVKDCLGKEKSLGLHTVLRKSTVPSTPGYSMQGEGNDQQSDQNAYCHTNHQHCCHAHPHHHCPCHLYYLQYCLREL